MELCGCSAVIWAGMSSRFFLFLLLLATSSQGEIRIGIVGTDTSHVMHFTRILNDKSAPDHMPGARVVAAYKGGSPDIPSSYTRVNNYAEDLANKYGVKIVADIPTLCSLVDAVLLESNDGRVHLAQARQVIQAGKRLFIDKPLAATLEDAREIARLAREAGVPWFSSSSLRWGDIATTMTFPDTTGIDVWGPGQMEEHHYLDLGWYAIHPIEMLYALIGTGCEEVTRIAGGTFEAGSDIIVGRWKDGRVGTVRTLRPSGGYGATVFRPKQVVRSPADAGASYVPLLRHILEFFHTGKAPVSNEETLEIFAFLDAAQRSKASGGKPMRLR
jgi:predicted dehydrogenase